MVLGTQSIYDKNIADNMVNAALKSLLAVIETYPNLRASKNFQKFQDELSDIQNKIQIASHLYNSNVWDFNRVVESFTYFKIAALFNFTRQDFFELEDGELKELVNKNPPIGFWGLR